MQVNMIGTMCMLLPAIHIINMFIISERPCPIAISIAICICVYIGMGATCDRWRIFAVGEGCSGSARSISTASA